MPARLSFSGYYFPYLAVITFNVRKNPPFLNSDVPLNNTKRGQIFSILRQQNPAPTTELQYNSPFELLVSVVLSAQATDVSVNKATEKLFREANTPEQFIKLGEPGLKQYIKSIGLYNSKAENIINTCKILVSEHAGEVPDDREALEKLPGVGRKTANVILNTAFGQPTIAVDTHIFRVSNRTGLAPGKKRAGSRATPVEVRPR